MLFKNTLKTVFLFLFICNSSAISQDIPLFYKNSTGSIEPVSVITGLNNNGKPLAQTYKGSDGQWHPTSVVAQICGTHNDGTPIACPSTDQLLSNVVTSSKINAKLGVAGLDANGSITSPVNTQGTIYSGIFPDVNFSAISAGAIDGPTTPLGDMLKLGRANFTSMIDGTSIVRITGSHRQANPVSEDVWTDPDGVILGGMAEGRGSHVVMTCQDEGGMNLGTCLSIWNSNSIYTGNRPGISPTTGEQMASYGTFDAVIEDNGTKSTAPKIIASAAFSSSDGVKHAVFFDSGSVWVSPVLSVVDRAKLKQHQTIISNVSTPDYVNRLDRYGTYAVNGFSGMLNNWNFGVTCPLEFKGEKLCDQLDVDTWVIPGSGITKKTNPQIYAVTASNLDVHYDQSATLPAIYVGARSKQFNHLLTCELGDFDTAPSTAGKDAQHSLMRECENGEYDDELFTTISGKYHFSGLTIGVDSHTLGTSWIDGTSQTDGYNAWPDKSSWGIYLGGQLPNLLELNPFTSDFVRSITGNTLQITNPISAGKQPGNTALYGSHFKNAGTSSMIFNEWQQCDAIDTQTCLDHNAMSWREGLRVGGTIGSLVNGASAAYVKYQGSGDYGICTASNTCTTMNSVAGWTFPAAVSINGPLNTSSLAIFSGGESATYINVDGIGSNTSNNVTFTSDAVFNKKAMFSNNLVVPFGTPISSTSTCTAGQIEMDATYIYSCIATDTWRRTSNGATW